MESRAKEAGISLEEQMIRGRKLNPTGHLGDPKDFGELCAFLCSVHTGYLTGQNIVIDGGSYPGTL